MAEYRINYTQSNFTGGVIAAELYGRNDFNKVKTGLKKCTNWTIREAGGLEFRRGTQYINTIPAEAGTKFKIASIGDVLIVFGATKIYYLKSDKTWGELAYPATPNLDTLMFEELKQRLFFYDGTINLSEIVLGAGNIPVARYTTFEKELVGTEVALNHTQDPDLSPRVDIEYSYTVALLSADGETESIAVMPAPTINNVNAELSGKEYVTITATFSQDVVNQYSGGRVLFFKRYQGIYYYLTSKDVKNVLTGADTNSYKRYTNGDTSSALAWRYSGTTYYTSGTSEPSTGDNIYSNAACTTVATTITAINCDTIYAYSDKGEFSVDTSKVIKKKPVYMTSDGYLPYVNSIADYGQRLFFTLSLSLSQTEANLIFTQIGNVNSLAYTELRNDDEAGFLAIPISHYDEWGRVVSGLDLLFGTSYTIQHITGYGDMQIEPLVFDGFSKNVQPVRTRRSLIYTNPNNKNIYDLSYNEYGQYDNPDLTLLVKYIFEDKTIKRLEIKDYPVKTIYVLCDDGELWCLTYLKDQNIYAWYKIEHYGSVHDIHVVNLDTEDEIYIVTRDNGNYVLELAYHRTDSVYMDGVVLIQRNTIGTDNVISGLPAWMEGKKVRVFDLGNNFYYGDYDIAHPQTVEEGGNVVQIDDVEFDGFLVENGSINLPDSISIEGNVLVGLPYYAVAETIPLEFQDQNGNSTIGRKKTISDAYLRYGDSRGLTYKTLGREYDCGIAKKDIADNAEFLERGQIRLNTESEYKWDSTIKLLQRQPYPARIESITLGLNFNDKS